MQTVWQESYKALNQRIPKIDIHTHILPREIPNFKKKFGYGGFISLEHYGSHCARMVRDDGKFFREIQKNCWDSDTRLKECDEHHVNIQVLSTVPIMFCYWAKGNDGYDIAKFLNDNLAQTVMEHPSRFIGLGTVPLQDPVLAVKELERCKKELGFAGVQIGSHVNDWNLDEPELFQFFEAASDIGASIFIHPWEMMGEEKMQKYWLPWLVGMPAETSRAICSMIFGGIFEKLPKLKVAFAHGGGSFPLTIGRIEHGFISRPDLCAIDNPVNPRNYLGKFYVDSLVHDANALRYLIQLFGANKIALGSDYPFPLGEQIPGTLIESMPNLDYAAKEWLLYKSACNWLGISDVSLLSSHI